jgi:hypothetical protein
MVESYLLVEGYSLAKAGKLLLDHGLVSDHVGEVQPFLVGPRLRGVLVFQVHLHHLLKFVDDVELR